MPAAMPAVPAAAAPRLRLFSLPAFSADPTGRSKGHWNHPRMVLVTPAGLWVLWPWDTLILHTVLPGGAHAYDFDRAVASLCTPNPCTTSAIAKKLMQESQLCQSEQACAKPRKSPALSACPYAAHAPGVCLSLHTPSDRKPWGNAFEAKRNTKQDGWPGADGDLAVLAAASKSGDPHRVLEALVSIQYRLS